MRFRYAAAFVAGPRSDFEVYPISLGTSENDRLLTGSSFVWQLLFRRTCLIMPGSYASTNSKIRTSYVHKPILDKNVRHIRFGNSLRTATGAIIVIRCGPNGIGQCVAHEGTTNSGVFEN